MASWLTKEICTEYMLTETSDGWPSKVMEEGTAVSMELTGLGAVVADDVIHWRDYVYPADKSGFNRATPVHDETEGRAVFELMRSRYIDVFGAESLNPAVDKSTPDFRFNRMLTGFKRLGYSYIGCDRFKTTKDFRMPNNKLRFYVRGGEGGVFLIWTEDEDLDLLSKKYAFTLPPDIRREGFANSGGFWRLAADVISGYRP